MRQLKAIEQIENNTYDILKDEKWLMYLTFTKESKVNLERIASFNEINHNYILNYVKKTLEILDESDANESYKHIVAEVLAWSEVAKGGLPHQRNKWIHKGYNLDIHNLGSASIYHEETVIHNISMNKKRLIYILIKTHGYIGQYIRGEVNISLNKELYQLVEENIIEESNLNAILNLLNTCIIKAVNTKLWDNISSEVKDVCHAIASGKFKEKEFKYPIVTRIEKLRRTAILNGEDRELFKQQQQEYIFNYIFENCSLWYVEAALSDFSFEEFFKIMALIYVGISNNLEDDFTCEHISFELFMNDIYYEYNGIKKVNIYKKRIIEKFLKELDVDALLSTHHFLKTKTCDVEIKSIENNSIESNNTKLNSIKQNIHIQSYMTEVKELNMLYFSFTYSQAATKLIQFCMEAEKSELLYEKAIILLYDLFELRKDDYDRFNEEAKYLATMNQSIDYKKVLLDYIVGKSVIDIGPGGGALMDLIEATYPSHKVIGVDISTNVIEALEKKKKLEHKNWDVRNGNALNLKESIENGEVDTIIFCSIIHELFSYIEFENKQFNHDTIAVALKSAYEVLPIGGRIIIRDGIMSEPEDETRIIKFLSNEGIEFLDQYCQDFKGRHVSYTTCGLNEVEMLINDAMEFLYTYTWGEKSYVHEVQEQFGYFTPTQFKAFIKKTFEDKVDIIEFRHFLQDGYALALSSKIEFYDKNKKQVRLPDSTYIAVLQKKG